MVKFKSIFLTISCLLSGLLCGLTNNQATTALIIKNAQVPGFQNVENCAYTAQNSNFQRPNTLGLSSRHQLPARGLNPPAKKNERQGKGIRLGIGPVIGFYSINNKHAKNITPRFGALISYKKETRFGRDYRTFFLYGIDYFIHGANFMSYYFRPDTLKLYNKKFTYKYALFLQEIDVPFQVKYSINRENNSQYTRYFMIGYHLRYLLPASLNITQNGNSVKRDQPQMKFKNYLFSEQLNAFLSASFGWQKNNTSSSKVGMYIEGTYRYGFSPYYLETDYSASSLFISSSHVSLQIGLKF